MACTADANASESAEVCPTACSEARSPSLSSSALLPRAAAAPIFACALGCAGRHARVALWPDPRAAAPGAVRKRRAVLVDVGTPASTADPRHASSSPPQPSITSSSSRTRARVCAWCSRRTDVELLLEHVGPFDGEHREPVFTPFSGWDLAPVIGSARGMTAAIFHCRGPWAPSISSTISGHAGALRLCCVLPGPRARLHPAPPHCINNTQSLAQPRPGRDRAATGPPAGLQQARYVTSQRQRLI